MLKEAEYLTENGLGDYLEIMFPQTSIIKQFRFPNSRYCYDYEIFSEKLLIEFDGDSHYTNPDVIKRDTAKSQLAKINGYKLIRFPYWVQIDAESILHYFNIKSAFTLQYPHGFISKKVILPSFYCELGTNRFLKELSELPFNIKKGISKSLNDKQQLYGKEFTANTQTWKFLSENGLNMIHAV